jgi:hypothetical protein
MVATPLLDSLKQQRRQDRRSVLKSLVETWMADNEDKLFSYTPEEFEVLRQLVVVGVRRDQTVFSPSSATSCQRKQVIDKFLPSIKLRDPRPLYYFDDGRWRHLRWQMVFFKMGIVDSIEEFTSAGVLEYGGTTDVRITIRVGGKQTPVIVDIKGANASRWNNINKTKKPLFDNLIQLLIYLHINDVEHGILWYENKNTNEICEISVSRKRYRKLLLKALKRQRYMKRYVQHTAFPKEECSVFDEKDRRFKNCPQRKNCPLLPVHVVTGGEVFKIGEPRKSAEGFTRFDTYPARTFAGSLGERKRRFKKLQT